MKPKTQTHMHRHTLITQKMSVSETGLPAVAQDDAHKIPAQQTVAAPHLSFPHKRFLCKLILPKCIFQVGWDIPKRHISVTQLA